MGTRRGSGLAGRTQRIECSQETPSGPSELLLRLLLSSVLSHQQFQGGEWNTKVLKNLLVREQPTSRWVSQSVIQAVSWSVSQLVSQSVKVPLSMFLASSTQRKALQKLKSAQLFSSRLWAEGRKKQVLFQSEEFLIQTISQAETMKIAALRLWLEASGVASESKLSDITAWMFFLLLLSTRKREGDVGRERGLLWVLAGHWLV